MTSSVTSDDALDVAVHVAAVRRLAEEAALVLTSSGLECRIDHTGGVWTIFVGELAAGRAREALEAYAQDVATQQAADLGPPSAGGIVCAAVLVAAYVLTGTRGDWSHAFQAGSAVAERIVAGEWWRVVTALTLHADAAHLLGNVASGALFITAVCRALGPGLGPALVLTTGGVGNLVAALVRRTASSSVGASTAIFGALGILCGRAVVRAARRRAPGRRPWIPLAAGLALLALLGTSERADLLAHLTGFVVGLPVGAVTAEMPRAARPVQLVLACGSALLVAISWKLALR